MIAIEMFPPESPALEVYNATVSTQPCRTRPAVSAQKARQRIVTTFHLSGGLVGIAAVSCPLDLASDIIAELLDTRIESVSAAIFDATIDIANVVVGKVKDVLGGEISALQVSAPSVSAEPPTVKGRSNLGRLTVRFGCAGHSFTMSVAILRKPASF